MEVEQPILYMTHIVPSFFYILFYLFYFNFMQGKEL